MVESEDERNRNSSSNDDGTVNMDPGAQSRRESAGAPQKIGQYVIKRIIASGGMGTVYEALQENPRRPAAVKVVKRNMASSEALRRFEREAQALARLRHSGIAQIYEAGTYEDAGVSLPFFALEYIPNAKSIIEYATSKGLDESEKLKLFLQVCEAVHYGHQRGIIHRDLKPGNILVDSEGKVRIIDFGVARAVDADSSQVDDQTKVGQIVGTAQYMSPEQFEADPNDLDTRSDVYALGVVLFELLSGKLPYDIAQSGIFEIARIVREEQPQSLSATLGGASGEVELITAKALKKDRELRYQSAFGLAEDIRRFLRGEAVSAKTGSFTYQMQVFSRKNKTAVAMASLVVFLLIAGVLTSTSLYFEMKAERARAEAAAAEAIAANEFLNNSLSSVVPIGWGDVRTIGDLCDQVSEEVDEAFPENPTAEADIRNTIGAIYSRLANRPQAEKELSEAYELRKEHLGPHHGLTLEALDDLWDHYFVYGPKNKGVEVTQLYYELLVETLGADHPRTLDKRLELLYMLEDDGRYVEAEEIAGEIRMFAEANYTDSLTHVLYAQMTHARLMLLIGDLSGAMDLALGVYKAHQDSLPADKKGLREARNTYATTIVASGDLDAAKELFGHRKAPNPVGIELEYQGELGDLNEGVKALIFFETWCPFSQKYIPTIEELNKQYSPLDVEILGFTRVRRNSSDEEVRKFIDQNNLSFSVLKENGRSWNYFEATGTPFTVILHEGEVIWESPGVGAVSSRLLEGIVNAL